MIRVFVVLFLLVIWFSVLLFGSHAVFLGLLTLVCAGVGLEMAAMLPSSCATEKRLLAVMGIACATSFVYGIGTADLVAPLLAVVLMGAAPFLVGDAEAPFSRGISFVGWGALIILAEVCLAGLARIRLRADGAQLVTLCPPALCFGILPRVSQGECLGRGV